MPVVDDEWSKYCARALKAELKRHGVTYEQLSERFKSIGVKESPSNISTKINSGRFRARFFLQVLSLLGARSINIPRTDPKGSPHLD